MTAAVHVGMDQSTSIEFDWQRRELQAAHGLRDPSDAPCQDTLPVLTDDQVELGVRLGSGTFSDVYLVKRIESGLIDCSSDRSVSQTESTTTEDELMDTSMRARSSGCERYALKRLHEETKKDERTKEAAARDIALEAGILAELPASQYIVRLHAVSLGFWDKPASGFVILDRLTDTLQERMQRWKCRKRIDTKIPFYQRSRKLQQRRQQQRARVSMAALGVARAMEHLHRHKVIYRDLKPANVGFDHSGTVRLFDFGLARVHVEGERRLTGFTGSCRYMAPEVTICEAYGFPADVYAFSVLLWEVCTLKKAFDGVLNVEDLVQLVVHKTNRPSLNKVASSVIKELLQACWDPNPELRPSFAPIVRQLEKEDNKVL